MVARGYIGPGLGVRPRQGSRIARSARDIGHFLDQTGRPTLVETANGSVSGLSSERASDDAGTKLAELVAFGTEPRELVGQLINFRLASGRGVVGRVFELPVDDPGCTLSQFQLREIGHSDL